MSIVLFFKNNRSKFTFYALLGVLSTLFLPIKYNSWAINVLVVAWLIEPQFKERVKRIINNKHVWVFIGFFLIYIVGLLYSDNIKYGVKFITRNLSFIIFPIILTSSNIDKEKKNKALAFFAYFTLIISVVLLVVALFNYFTTGDFSSLFYDNYTQHKELHPVYFGMYFLFSISVIVNRLRKIRNKKKSLKILSLIFYSIVILILISSKIIIAIALVLMIGGILSKGKITVKKVGLSLLVLLSMVVVIASFSVTRKRFMDTLNPNLEIIYKGKYAYNENFSGLTLRLVFWKIGIEHIIKDGYLIEGVGTGDFKDYTNTVYTKHNLHYGKYLDYNAHNQFVQVFICLGLIGLVYFMYMIYRNFLIAIRNKDIEFLVFAIIFSCTCFSESVLQVHKGIVFFTLFSSMFLCAKKIT